MRTRTRLQLITDFEFAALRGTRPATSLIAPMLRRCADELYRPCPANLTSFDSPTFANLQRPLALLALATPVVVPRAPLNAHELLQQIAARQDAATANVWRPWILPLEAAMDSSTQLRKNILTGAALDHTLIDPHVLAYIKQYSLYK